MHMNEIDIAQPYTPAEAERGKFAVIDPTVLTSLGYPTTGSRYGRYAVLTYSIGSDTTNAVLSGGLPNSTTEQLLTLSASALSTVSFSPVVTLMEISNRSAGAIYVTYNGTSATTVLSLTTNGLPIAKGAFYSIERTTAAVTIASVDGGNVVVFGHYKA